MRRERPARLAVGATLRTVIALGTRLSRRPPLGLRWRLRRRIRPAAAPATSARIDVFHRWLTSFTVLWHSTSNDFRRVDHTLTAIARIGRRPSAAMPILYGGASTEFRRIYLGSTSTAEPRGLPVLGGRNFTRHFQHRFTHRESQSSRSHVERQWTNERRLSERSRSVLTRRAGLSTVHRHQHLLTSIKILPALGVGRGNAASRPSDFRPASRVAPRMPRPVVQIWRTRQASPEAVTGASAPPSAPPQLVAAGKTTEWRSAAITRELVESPPDMNRLIDEVLRRIERQARSERTRRGI